MKRIGLIVIAGAALCLPAVSAGATVTSSRAAKVQVRHTALGSILTNGRGFTLYVFTRDSRKHDSCMGIKNCARVWPVLMTSGASAAGPGVSRSRLGTIKLANGARQVTYAGHPLYTYVGDGGPGQTEYVGFSQFGGRWYAINAAGRIVK